MTEGSRVVRRRSVLLVVWSAGAVLAAITASSPFGGGVAVLGLGLGTACLFRSKLRIPTSVLALAVSYGVAIFAAGCIIWRYAPPVDAVAYVQAGSTLAGNGLTSTQQVSDVVLVEGKSGYVYVLAALFVIFGSSAYVGAALSGVALTWCVVFVYKAALDLGIARPTVPPWLVVLFPGLFLWAAPPLREGPVLLCVAVMMWAGIELASDPRRVGRWSALLLSILGLVYLRGPLVLALVPAVALGGTVASRGLSKLGVLLVSGVAGGLAFVLASAPLQGIFARADRESISVSQAELASATSGFAASPGPVGTLEGVARVLLGPFPWEAGAAGIALIEAPIWIALTLTALMGIRRAGTRVAVPVAMGLILAIVIAVTVGNYGTLLRIRLGIIPCLVVVAGAAVGGKRTKSSVRRHVNQ